MFLIGGLASSGAFTGAHRAWLMTDSTQRARRFSDVIRRLTHATRPRAAAHAGDTSGRGDRPIAMPWVGNQRVHPKRNPVHAREQRRKLSRHRRLNSRPFRTTIYSILGTLAAVSVAATVIASGSALISAPDAANPAPGTAALHAAFLSGASVRLPARSDMQALSGVAQPADSALRVALRAPARFRRGAPLLTSVRGMTAAGTPQQIAMTMLPSFGWQ